MQQNKRANSQKPSSAPSKNRIRSQSPINIDSQGQNGNQGFSQHGQGAKKNNLVGQNYPTNNSMGMNNKMLSNTGGFGSMMT